MSSASVMSLNAVAQKQELRHKGTSTFLPANPLLKEAIEKFEQDVKNANLPEGKFVKLLQASGKWVQDDRVLF